MPNPYPLAEPVSVPGAVENSIRDAFPHDADDVLSRMHWDDLHGCYMVMYKGLLVGIETDGYIHT
jgi:hypothetical protein